MYFKCVICLFFVVQIVLGGIQLEINLENYESEEYEFEKGGNLDIKCYGNEPIQWELPRLSDKNTKIITKPLPRNKTMFGSLLEVRNISYLYVGNYKCVGKSQNKSIYFYVKDLEHLYPYEKKKQDLYIVRGRDCILPCKPSFRGVNITVYTQGNYVQFGRLMDGFLYSKHPRLGIWTNDTNFINIFPLSCDYQYENITTDLSVVLHFEEARYFLKTPSVQDVKFNHRCEHTEIGEKLELECEIEEKNEIKMYWILPNKTKILGDKNTLHARKDIKTLKLTVKRTTKGNIGEYTCLVEDYQNNNVTISTYITLFEPGQNFLYLTKLGNDSSIIKAGSNISMAVKIQSHPKPFVLWKMPNHNLYKPVNVTNCTHTTLFLNDVDINDTGRYTVEVSNHQEKKEISFDVNITVKPYVQIRTDDFHLINENSTVKCIVGANPPPKIQWFYKDDCKKCDYRPINETGRRLNKVYLIESYLTINASRDGHLKCNASNTEGYDSDNVRYVISDVKNGFDVIGLDEFYVLENKVYIAAGQSISLTCGSSRKKYSEPEWYVNKTKIEINSDIFKLESATTNYSRKSYLKKDRAKSKDSGKYECKVMKHDNSYKPIIYDLFILNASSVNVVLNHSSTVKLNRIQPITLTCEVFGLPKPKAVWLKDKNIIESNKTIIVLNGIPHTMLNITIYEEGTYECKGNEYISKKIYVVSETTLGNKILFICLGLLLAILLIVIAIAFKIYKSKQKLEDDIKQARLDFQEGAMDKLNPNLAIDEQADLLPYDDKFEFPLERLKMGKQLGSGAFGVVMKAVARRIVDHEDMTVVAVKMVKKNADPGLIKALASELKIMVHLGKHLNVLNLLGACTQNVGKNELMMIVEFCRYGNLHNYIQRQRDNFINQIDPTTQSADFRIGWELLERVYSPPNSPDVKYHDLSFQHARRFTGSSQGSRHYSVNYTAKTEMSSLSNNSECEEVFLSNNSSVQPEWRSNYRGDYKGNVKPICTKDLICWAFQVSRGMEYLASRKVLHGDLAARNILLAENNIVKICDFGLAKSMYHNDNYQKKGEALLPLRWMAIESIRDRIFSTQSDVWSFGVVLWEFFSLSRSPYPGILPNKTLYDKLVSGYRMEKPEFAPKEVHDIMMDCWLEIPQSRPSFELLTERLGDLLEDKTRRHYIDLNDPYLKMNTETLDLRPDYLEMVSPPDFGVITSPILEWPDSPSEIFSPRIKDGQIFDFPGPQGKIKKLSETGNEQEMQPIMSVKNPDSFSNPSYHLPPKVGDIKTLDNYVNMHQNKHDIKQKKKNTEREVDMPNYINDCSRDWEGVNA